MTSKLSSEIVEAARAGNGGIWVKSQEGHEAIRELAALNSDEDAFVRVHLWNAVDGLQVVGAAEKSTSAPGEGPPEADLSTLTKVTQALDWFLGWTRKIASLDEDAANEIHRQVLVLQNGHSVFDSPSELHDAIALMQQCIHVGKVARCHIVVLAHSSVEVPVELREVFWPLEHQLPTADQRSVLIGELASSTDIQVTAEERDRLAGITGGLTRTQIETICSVSILRHNKIEEGIVTDEKSRLINQGGVLTLSQVRSDFTSIGGMEGMKTYCRDILKPRTDGVRPKGILLLGIGGCGKTAGARALGNEVGRPTLELNPGQLMGSLVGQTEEQTRMALATADAMEPCQLYVDELDRVMPKDSGGGDSGVGTRLLGTIMTWLNDHTSDVFFIASANSLDGLPSQFTRAERFDAVFFVDLPTPAVRREIWNIHRALQQTPEEYKRPRDADWSGAEIAACCRIARLRGVSLVEAAESIVPISESGKEDIAKLRKWATGRVLCAETGKLYQPPSKSTTNPKVGKATVGRKIGK